MVEIFPTLPKSWSELSWQQLNDCWQAKMRYGGHADVARVEGLLAMLGLEVCRRDTATYSTDGESVYQLCDKEGNIWTVTARELSQMALQTMAWFDWPYGDPGEKEETDEKGAIVKARREPVTGYVSQMRDAMILPMETIKVGRKHFSLPQVACNNLTWQQYRALQNIAPQLFQEGIDDATTLDLQAQFLAHCLVPRSLAILDTAGGSIRIRPHWEYRYNADQAESMVKFWKRQKAGSLFHIVFQTYQTALTYYSTAYPLLFGGDSGKSDQMRDALQGEVGTINTIMKYAGYAEQQQVYDSNLPFVLDILNTMAKEAKEIEKMNSKIKKR